MKKCVPVLILMVLAASDKAFSDQSDDVAGGTATLTLTAAAGDNVTVDGKQTIAGPYSYTISNVNATGPGTMISAGNYQGFCVDLGHDIYFNSPSSFTVYDVSASPSMGVTGLGLTGTKLQNVFKLMEDYYLANGNSIAPVAGKNADALTVALWATLSGDTSIDGSSPSLPVSFTSNNEGGSQAVALANTWLSSLGSTQAYGGQMYAFESSNGVQGQEIMITSPPFTQVPEPGPVVGLAGMALAGLTLSLAGLMRRRRAVSC
jgi:hypothetical protein